MFEKRLFSLVPQATPYIMASVLFKWIALMANITVMWMLARILGGIVTNGLSAALAVDALAQAALPLAAAIIVRAASIYLAQRAGDKAAFEAVRRVRSLVYDKLTALGPSYTETVPTAEAVQTSVEGATQLQVYFGGYLPQLFFAGLAPITLFVLLVGQAGLPAALLLACVPVIPVSIMMVMRNAKKIGSEYWGSYVDLGGMFLEAVQGLTTLKVYQADRSWHERINAESERFRTATMRLLVMQLRSICVMDLVVYMGAALGIIVAALQLATGKIGFEAAFLIVFLSQEFFLPMRRLGSLFHTAMNGMAASRRMFGILDTPEPERGDVELDGRGDIELAGVSYAYGDRTVLDSARSWHSWAKAAAASPRLRGSSQAERMPTVAAFASAASSCATPRPPHSCAPSPWCPPTATCLPAPCATTCCSPSPTPPIPSFCARSTARAWRPLCRPTAGSTW